jgi:EAL domain-containing protein (putative c-di-GMP-specific phosphodiesterase class I)
LALGDFGAAYSSFSDLKCFPIGTLEIAQSFVRDITAKEDGVGFVIGLIRMGNGLQMRVVADGIETRE